MKNLQNFDTFILEINRFKDKTYFSSTFKQDDLKGYEYEEGEIVMLKHPSWKESYNFRVTVGGKQPTLVQIDGNGGRQVTLDNPNRFQFIKLVSPKIDKPKVSKPVKERGMTEKQYMDVCKSIVSSGSDDLGREYDHSELYDMAINQVLSDKKVRDYLRKQIEEYDPDLYRTHHPSDRECAEQMANDLTSVL